MSDLDDLMSKDPLQLSQQDLDRIIAYQRDKRAKYETTGGKAKKDDGPKKNLTLADLNLGIKAKPEGAPIKRRI